MLFELTFFTFLIPVAQNGYTAVHRAANGGFLEVVKLLVAAGADLTLADKV